MRRLRLATRHQRAIEAQRPDGLEVDEQHDGVWCRLALAAALIVTAGWAALILHVFARGLLA